MLVGLKFPAHYKNQRVQTAELLFGINFSAGVTVNNIHEIEPVLSPQIVIFLGFPPNSTIFSLIHVNVAI